jgi:hypothetical protein
MPMRKVLAVSVIAIALLAFALMAKSVIFGDQPPRSCATSDYACNYQQYMADISRKPPDFSRAESVAIATPEALRRNLSSVLSLPDYKSASMLRVILAYPPGARRDLCKSRISMAKLQSRGERISSPYQRQEYQRLLSSMGCAAG